MSFQNENEEIFNLLSENAFKALIESLTMLGNSKELKYAVIIFCHGMELLLKARIVKEHWSLICEKPGDCNLEEFKLGKFKSIGIKRAIDLLEKMSNEEISKEFRDSMFKLIEHRNQFMHFFHFSASNSNKIAEDVVSLQFRNLGYLRKCNFYEEYFIDYNKYKEALYLCTKDNSKYLIEKFTIEKNKLEKLRSEGIKISICPTCEFESFVQDVCLVCEYDESNAVLITKDNYEELGEVYCPYCEAITSISFEDKQYHCLRCKQQYSKISQCEFCSASQLGPLEDSYLEGCGQCDGHPDWG